MEDSPPVTRKQDQANGRSVLRLFRLLAWQQLSVPFENGRVFSLRIGDTDCRFFIDPVHEHPSDRRVLGGSWIHVEYSIAEPDLIRATAQGMEFARDLLAGIALVGGQTFQPSFPVEVVDVTTSERVRFVTFVSPNHWHWHSPITPDQLNAVQSILLHWDRLEQGNRLRRAAMLYLQALGQDYDLGAFQAAYTGLEALDPPLAKLFNIPAGYVEEKGRCDSCNAEYTRKRTELSGVKSYVSGNRHPRIDAETSAGRLNHWKQINRLRNKIVHALDGLTSLEAQAQKALPTALHYLHDAICCLSHSHELESNEFRFIRGATRFVLRGRSSAPISLKPLDERQMVLEVRECKWVPNEMYGFIPELTLHNSLPGVEVELFAFNKPLQVASEKDLAERWQIETDHS